MYKSLFDHIEKFISLELSDIDKLESCLKLLKIKKERACIKRRTNLQYFLFRFKRLYAPIYYQS